MQKSDELKKKKRQKKKKEILVQIMWNEVTVGTTGESLFNLSLAFKFVKKSPDGTEAQLDLLAQLVPSA